MGLEKNEEAIKKTWSEFRNALAKGEFSFDQVSKAKEYTFLKVYDDLFHQHSGIVHNTILIKDLDGLSIGRGTVLREKEVPDYSVAPEAPVRQTWKQCSESRAAPKSCLSVLLGILAFTSRPCRY